MERAKAAHQGLHELNPRLASEPKPAQQGLTELAPLTPRDMTSWEETVIASTQENTVEAVTYNR